MKPYLGELAASGLLFALILVHFAYLNFSIGYWSGLRPEAWWLMSACSLALVGAVLWVPRRWRGLASLAVLGAVAITTWVDLGYFRYFQDITPVRSWLHAGQVVDVTDSLGSLVKLRDGVLLLALAGLPLMGRLLRQGAPWPLKPRLITALGTLGVGLGMLGHTVWSLPPGERSAIAMAWDRVELGVRYGVFTYHLIDAGKLFLVPSPPPPSAAERAELSRWFARRASAPTSGQAPQAVGRNLIVIQVEALQGFVLGRRVNGRAVTPNLDRLAAEGLYFPNTYAQIRGGGTSDAEYMLNTSHYPAPEGSVFVQYAHNEQPALAPELARKGYTTLAMHANRRAFWNRGHMYEALGFGRFYADRDFTLDDILPFGLSDASFLRQSAAILKQTKQPFYAELVTLTSHYPYARAATYSDFDTTGVTVPIAADYLKSIHYVDRQIGQFVETLKRDGLWNQSVVALYGDHAGFPSHKREELRAYLAADPWSALDWMKIQRVPLILHVPGAGLSGRRDITAGQIDIMPTLARLLGAKPPSAFGQDLLGASEGFVALRDGSVLTDTLYYNGREKRAYAMRDGADAPVPPVLLARAREHLRYSDLMLFGNLARP